jgi:hypothetical protein
MIALRLRMDRYPLALALAAWTRLLMPSRMPLAILLSNHRRIPSQWRLTVRAASMTGLRRQWVAQKYHFVRKASAASRDGWA